MISTSGTQGANIWSTGSPHLGRITFCGAHSDSGWVGAALLSWTLNLLSWKITLEIQGHVVLDAYRGLTQGTFWKAGVFDGAAQGTLWSLVRPLALWAP